MAFIRNAWYVAMWAEQLKPSQPQERTIIGESLVIYRGTQGQPIALQNRCPHRSAPLHMGRVCTNGNIECGYHGLQFNESGACVVNPHGKGVIPVAAKLRAFEAVEKHSLIWVWMGDGQADAALIPNLSIIDTAPAQDVTYRDVLEMKAGYELVIDNLLDLSHTGFLHRGVLGNSDTVSAEIKVRQDGDAITVGRWMPGVVIPGLFDIMFPRKSDIVDLWAEITWLAPCSLINDSGVTAPGTSREQGTGIYGLHLLTPVNERKTVYHFAAIRHHPFQFPEDIRLDLMTKLKDLRRSAFETEDEPMIEAQQRMLDAAQAGVQPVLLEVDAASVRYKRVLQKLLEAESGPRSPALG